jgi:hypothetical protein
MRSTSGEGESGTHRHGTRLGVRRSVAFATVAGVEPGDISSEWLSSVFDAEVTMGDTTRIGDGLVGMNVRIELQSAAEHVPASVIAKLPSPDQTSRATGVALRNYEREVKFYREVAPTIDMRVPQCHLAEWDETSGDFTLLLEDLAPASQGDQILGCGADRSRLAVLELARLHGPRWADDRLESMEWLQRRTAEDGDRLGMLWAMFMPSFLQTYAKHLTVDAVGVIERFGERLGDWLYGREGELTVTHGDYRLDNLMFGGETGAAPIAAVDWQTPGHGQATGDLSYFLGAGPLPEDRRAIERGLVDEYGAALAAYGVHVDGIELWRQYCRDAYSGVIMAVIASQIVGASDRSEAMFAAMATRHCQHVLDVGSEALI